MRMDRTDRLWQAAIYFVFCFILLASALLVTRLTSPRSDIGYFVIETSLTADNGAPLLVIGGKWYYSEKECWRAASYLNEGGRYEASMVFMCARQGGNW